MGLDSKFYAVQTAVGLDNETNPIFVAINALPEVRDLMANALEKDDIELRILVAKLKNAHHVHDWIMDNCDCNEDRTTADSTREWLECLLGLCNKALNNKDTSQLLDSEGEYGPAYWKAIQDTQTICQRLLSIPKNWEFEYRASW